MTFSIITPSFGQLDWLRLCVASVAGQVAMEGRGSSAQEEGAEYQSADSQVSGRKFRISPSHGFALEHIIQDGGTPGIEEFARENGAEFYRDGKLVFGSRSPTTSSQPYRLAIYTEADAGMYDAINKGMARMSGDLWAWLNSDEQYLPGTLEFVSRWFAEHSETEILCGDALLTDDKGNPLSYRRIVRPLWHHTRLVHLSSLSCASFYRRTILDRVGGFNTSWRAIGDAEWMARIMKARARIVACGKLLSTFAFTGQNTSESLLAKKEAEEWRRGADAPAGWMRLPVICVHRLRKFLAGAYCRRAVTYEIHQKGKGRSLVRAEGIGWDWPCAAGSQEVKGPVCFQRENRQVPYADTTKVLGTALMETNYDELSSILLDCVSRDGGAIAVDFANTHVVTMRRHDARFDRLTECIDLTVPDGMPLVWAMNAKGASLKDRVYGPTFTRRFLASCPAGKTHYLVGGSETCGRKFQKRMHAMNSSLEFVGGFHGGCLESGLLENDEAVFRDIEKKRPDFIWVGLGTPKQYAWIHRIKPRLNHGILLAVGFAFDVNAGVKPDAPLWMQRIGLTWMYRVATEPRRLLGRYLKWNALFGGYWLLEWSRLRFRSIKLRTRNLVLGFLDLFGREISDCETGQPLGRALIMGWGRGLRVIGHAGLPPLIPRFLPQRRLNYWRQRIGFTTYPRPDFPRLEGIGENPPKSDVRVLNVVLTHFDGELLSRTIERWRGVCTEENLWIAFGGKRHRFERLELEQAVFIGDPCLRREDNQREKQSYTGIFQAVASVIEREKPDYVYLCEYDHAPLRYDLNAVQVAEITSEGADVMGHWLYRVDRTSHYHMLYHQSDPGFLPYWRSVSRREDKGVVLSMFGSGSLWSKEAFLAIASRRQEIPCYLELYLPTLAHHLGFRVRCWDESRHMISNLTSRNWTIEEARKRNCITIHPVK